MKELLAICERVGGILRRQRAYFAVVLPIALPLLLASGTTTESSLTPVRASDSAPPQVRYTDLAAPSQATLQEHSIMLTLEDGDTLDSIFAAGGLSRSEAAGLTSEFGKAIDVRRLRPGHLLRFHHDRAGSVDSVEMKVIGWGEVDAVRNGDHFDVKSREGTAREVESTLTGTVDTSLWDAVRGGGESPQLVQQIADVFQWDIDFFALKRGDSFSLVVRKKYLDGDPVGSGKIMAARFQHRGRIYEAFRNDDAEGQGGYYNGAGAPLQKQFLRAPLRYSRITSGFSMNRYHPILHILRPHHGVDYGAPVGTPVMTTANGVVLEAGRKGGEGNYIRINHGNHIETHYLHLSRFAKGIRPGCKVTQGEVIGYVGATGLATGPHLDYRISDNGEWLDPLKLRSTTPDPLSGKGLEEFRAKVARLQPRLAAPAEQVAQQIAPKRRALF